MDVQIQYSRVVKSWCESQYLSELYFLRLIIVAVCIKKATPTRNGSQLKLNGIYKVKSEVNSKEKLIEQISGYNICL